MDIKERCEDGLELYKVYKSSFSWILEILKSSVFTDDYCEYSLFVAGDDKTLHVALRWVYPALPRIIQNAEYRALPKFLWTFSTSSPINRNWYSSRVIPKESVPYLPLEINRRPLVEVIWTS